MKKYTVEELDNICYVSGLSNISVFYTGGGIYCFIGDMGGLGVSGSSEGNFEVTDVVPTVEQFDDCDWLNVHQVADLTEEEQLTWTYYFLNYFKDAYHENDDTLINYKDCNVSLNEINDIILNWHTFHNESEQTTKNTHTGKEFKSMTVEQLKIFVDTLNKRRFPAKRRWELDNHLYALADALKASGLKDLAKEIGALADSIEDMKTSELLKNNIFE